MNALKILVSDDEVLWREKILTRLLEDEGYEVEVAATIEETLEALERKFFHVVVADICFSQEDHRNVDGMRTVREVRRLGEGTRVIVLTGYGTVDLAVRAFREDDVFHFLEKGKTFEREEFLDVVGRAGKEASVSVSHPGRRIDVDRWLAQVGGELASNMEVKQTELAWVAKNALNQVSPVVVTQDPAELVDSPRGDRVLRRQAWSRGLGKGICLYVGASSAVSSLTRDATVVASASQEKAHAVVVADASVSRASF